MAKCPNVSHPDYKVLEARHGKKGAFRMYIENGYDIPVPENVSKRATFGWGGITLKSRDTMEAMDKNPEMAQVIVDRLSRLMPNVKIHKDGLFDKDGNWIEIPAGEKGMHYRNAFQGAVAWANDAYLETPPHEYAHEYVDMFRELPVVKRGIEKYGEEQLVKRMGAYYAKRAMSNSFQKYMQDFWANIRAFLGSPDVADVLSKNFYEGKMFDGPVHKGTAIFRYQKGDGVLKPTNGGVNSNGQYDNDTDIKNAREITDEDAIAKIKREAIAYEAFNYDENDIIKTGEANDVNVNKLRSLVRNRIAKLRKIDRTRDGEEWNAPKTDSRLLEDTIDIIENDEALDNIAKELLGIERKNVLDSANQAKKDAAERIKLTAEEQKAYDTILAVEKRLAYKQLTDNSYYDGNGKLVSSEVVNKTISNEVKETSDRREYLYNKIPSKMVREKIKSLEKLLQYQLNSRLIAKYLSGSEQSELYDMAYRAIDQADRNKHKILQGFVDIFKSVDTIPGFKNWSIFNKKGSSIDELETMDVNTTEKKMKLTKAEYLGLYLNLRQSDSRAAIMNKGFIIDQKVKGRDGLYNESHKILPSEADNIMKTVESDSQMMEVVGKIDEALDYMYEQTNRTFMQEQGYELEKRPNYFPGYAGEKSISQIRRKNSLDEWRSGNARLGQDKPMRISDAFEVLNNNRNSGAVYASHALPISNMRKLIASVSGQYVNKQENTYFKNLEGVIEDIEAPGQVFGSEGQRSFAQKVNVITSNFAVSVLGMNLAVMPKQTVSYITAMEEIDKRYLKEAGWGISGFVGVNPIRILKSLKWTGIKGGETMLPLEWKLDTENNPIYDEMMQDPKMRARLQGMLSKEAGEALLNAEIGKDKINTVIKYKGEKLQISKARLMEGIKIFDSVTVMAIWKAVKLETAEQQPQLVEGTQEYKDHVSERANDIINKTQPTYDAANRSILSLDKNPIARVFTMFGSARSKVAMLMVDSVVSYINNPSPENKKKLYKRSLNVMVTTSLALAAIDMLKGGMLYGYDDDDDYLNVLGMNMISNNLGYFYGISSLSSLFLSQIDDKPWHKNMQHPVEGMVQELSEALSHVYKGNFNKAFLKSLDVSMKATGLPTSMKTYTKAAFSERLGD